MDGVQLKPQKMDAADLAAYRKKEMFVQQLMERYYPTKLQPKVSEEAFRMPKTIAGPEGDIKVEKFNVYKEKDEQRPDYGKYKFYAQMGDTKMSAVASREDLNAYFDRTMSPSQLIEKNFGERFAPEVCLRKVPASRRGGFQRGAGGKRPCGQQVEGVDGYGRQGQDQPP